MHLRATLTSLLLTLLPLSALAQSAATTLLGRRAGGALEPALCGG